LAAQGVSGCGGDSSSQAIAEGDGSVEASALEAGSDAPGPDAGRPDATRPDAGGSEAGAPDAAPGDACATHLVLGANIHNGASDDALLSNELAARNLKRVRMDFYPGDSTYESKTKAALAQLTAHQIKAEGILNTSYSPANPNGQTCNADLVQAEQGAYGEATAQLKQMQADGITAVVSDIELMNETDLSHGIQVQGTTGQQASDFDTPCGRLQAANSRGMSRAIVDFRKSAGLPTRIILGTTSRHWGFLSFMESQGVTFDVVGYHIYPWYGNAPLDSDPWFGAGGPLGQLALFKRPVHVNEFNCGEIYMPSTTNDGSQYDDTTGSPSSETCWKSVAKHMSELANQSVADVESIIYYEALNEPTKSPPEDHFGLMFDLSTPKIGLYLASAFAGGSLSSVESGAITSRGLLTEDQIQQFHLCRAQ
jgi:hypothetical protein